MHQPAHRVLRGCVSVVMHSLHQRRGTVADAHDGYPDLPVAMSVPLIGAHAPTSSRTFSFCVIPSIWFRRSRSRLMFSTSREQYTCRPSRRVLITPPRRSIRRCQEKRGSPLRKRAARLFTFTLLTCRRRSSMRLTLG